MHLLKENKKTVFIFAMRYGQNIFKEHKNFTELGLDPMNTTIH